MTPSPPDTFANVVVESLRRYELCRAMPGLKAASNTWDVAEQTG
jgi:hypothetical protein